MRVLVKEKVNFFLVFFISHYFIDRFSLSRFFTQIVKKKLKAVKVVHGFSKDDYSSNSFNLDSTFVKISSCFLGSEICQARIVALLLA